MRKDIMKLGSPLKGHDPFRTAENFYYTPGTLCTKYVRYGFYLEIKLQPLNMLIPKDFFQKWSDAYSVYSTSRHNIYFCNILDDLLKS